MDIVEKSFEEAFGAKPAVCVRSPGRINMIGEHVDYMGYSVFPAATANCICAAAGISKVANAPMIEIRNSSENFPTESRKSWEDFRIPLRSPSWMNYIVSAVFGLFEFHVFGQEAVSKTINPQKGLARGYSEKVDKILDKIESMNLPPLVIYYSGDVPVASGVSSSSSLIVGTQLAILNVWKLNPEVVNDLIARTHLAMMSEHHTGMACGGMDQACIVNAKDGFAQYVSFKPLGVEHYKVPSCCKFVVMNTYCTSQKSVTAPYRYNKRVFECRIAAFLLAKKLLNRTLTEAELLKYTLRDLQTELGAKEGRNIPLTEMAEIAEKHLSSMPTSRQFILDNVGFDVVKIILSGSLGMDVWNFNTIFEPSRRAIHVFGEAARTERFRDLTLETNTTDEDKLKEIGQILDASHTSLATLYDVSCPELEFLTEKARNNGALGCRVIGAGWGGCVLAAVHEDKVEDFLSKMTAVYETRKAPEDRFCPSDVNFKDVPKSSWLFASAPAQGAEFKVIC